MAATSVTSPGSLISIDEYLNTTYRPDVDYVDGTVEERNLGETDHAKLQTRLAVLLSLREADWGIEVMTEVRVQVSATRFRIPDVCLVREGGADDPIVTQAPLLCIEVLSSRDSLVAMRRRAKDYFDMGVPEVWILDPSNRTASVCTLDSISQHTEGPLRLAGTEVELSIADVFKPLKRRP